MECPSLSTILRVLSRHWFYDMKLRALVLTTLLTCDECHHIQNTQDKQLQIANNWNFLRKAVLHCTNRKETHFFYRCWLNYHLNMYCHLCCVIVAKKQATKHWVLAQLA
jgi:hypothetical protein